MENQTQNRNGNANQKRERNEELTGMHFLADLGFVPKTETALQPSEEHIATATALRTALVAEIQRSSYLKALTKEQAREIARKVLAAIGSELAAPQIEAPRVLLKSDVVATIFAMPNPSKDEMTAVLRHYGKALSRGKGAEDRNRGVFETLRSEFKRGNLR